MTPVNANISETSKRTGSHTITDGPVSITGSNPISKFAQACLGMGYNPQRNLIIKRSGTILFEPATLQVWAAKHDKKDKVDDPAPETPH